MSITFDTGALIGLERRHQRIRHVVERAKERGFDIHVPSVCVAEWWRKRTDRAEMILDAVEIVHTDDELVRLAGEAQALVPKATTIDAISNGLSETLAMLAPTTRAPGARNRMLRVVVGRLEVRICGISGRDHAVVHARHVGQAVSRWSRRGHRARVGESAYDRGIVGKCSSMGMW